MTTRREQLANAFRAFDTDDSGTLTADELREILVLQGGGNPLPSEDADEERAGAFEERGRLKAARATSPGERSIDDPRSPVAEEEEDEEGMLAANPDTAAEPPCPRERATRPPRPAAKAPAASTICATPAADGVSPLRKAPAHMLGRSHRGTPAKAWSRISCTRSWR